MTDATRPTFWQWFDSRKAQALETDMGKFMASRGYSVAHTGGGCLAWEGPSREQWGAWLTDGDLGLGDDLPDWRTAQTFGASLTHEESGDFIYGPRDVTIEAALAWSDKAMTLLPGTRVKLVCDAGDYPAHAPAGSTGVLTRVTETDAWVKLDRHFPDLKEWGNELSLNPERFHDYLEPTTETQPSRESNPLDAMRIVYTGDNEGPAVMTLGELIRNFDESGGWYDRMSAEHMRDELDSRGWVSGLHDNGHYLVMNVNKLRVEPHPTLDDEAFERKQAAKAAGKPVCEAVADEAPACRHTGRDDGRGRCVDCGAFI